MIHFSLVAGFFLLQINFAIILGADPKLVLVNVLHRHGDRTPSDTETYPNDPYINYTYYPIGRGELTNEGKLRAHQLGEFLKSRYGDFFGPIYTPEVLNSRSTDFPRTKMSLQLVQSALYPPEPIQQWNGKLLWQPIPAEYMRLDEDFLLFPEFCSSAYTAELERVTNTAKVQEKVARFKQLMISLGKLTGQTMIDTRTLFGLYHTFDAQLAANLTLPKWVYEFYPNGKLLEAVTFEYKLMSYNNALKKKFGGTLLRKIIDDVASYANGTLVKGRKLFHYSAHEVNIAAFQSTLGVYEPHVPAYSSAVIIEIWQQDEELYVKVLYYTGIPAKVITQQIPGCDVLCPFEKFLRLLRPVIATDSDLVCVSETSAKITDERDKHSKTKKFHGI